MRLMSGFVVAVLVIAMICQGCANPVELDQINVILISIDTLRADHLGVYGYHRDTSPAIDRFAREGVMFRDAIAQAPRTLPSHAAIFTSLLPSHSGALANYRFKLSDEELTMAEILSDHGFATAAFNDGGLMAANYGFAQGFDLYDSTMVKSDFVTRITPAKEWISQHRDEPFFLFLHTYEVHLPLEPAPEYVDLFEPSYSGSLPDVIRPGQVRKFNQGETEISQADLDHLIALYDASIRSMDGTFQDLIQFLKASDCYDSSLIVFTSDHGEEYGERGRVAHHGATLHDEVVRVPLIIKLPDSLDNGPQVVEAQVRSLDILPTVLEVVGIPARPHFEGTSLVGAALGEDQIPLPAVSQIGGGRQVSLRHSPWKLIRKRRGTRLYNLCDDPSESRNVQRRHKRAFDRLDSKLERMLAARPAKETPYKPTDEEIEQLRALGYVD